MSDTFPASRLRSLREAAGMSQTELAEAAEVRQGTISSIERGKAQPGYDTLAALAKALGISVVELITEKDPKKK